MKRISVQLRGTDRMFLPSPTLMNTRAAKVAFHKEDKPGLTKSVTTGDVVVGTRPLIKGIGWFTIKELIEIETAKMVFKSLNDSAPKCMAQMFQRLSDTSV